MVAKAPASVARRLSLQTTSFRGSPGGEDAAVNECRTRLKEVPRSASVVQQQRWLAWGMAPLVDYAVSAYTLNALTILDDAEFGTESTIF